VSYQKSIFVEGYRNFYTVEYKLMKDIDTAKLKSAIKNSINREMKNVKVVLGFGKSLWTNLNNTIAPKGFKNFEDLKGENDFIMKASQNDIFFWIQGETRESVFDVSQAIDESLNVFAKERFAQVGFTYHDSRDLTGFVDGSANPKDDDRKLAALIPEDENGANGSFVFVQKWIHDLKSFNEMSINDQEKTIGRTKEDSIELEGDDMPPTSHVSRTDVKHEGEAMKIYRRSFPYASLDEKGLLFLAFAKDIFRFEIQLKRMLGISGDGFSDKLMQFSNPVRASYYFAPSEKDLNKTLS